MTLADLARVMQLASSTFFAKNRAEKHLRTNLPENFPVTTPELVLPLSEAGEGKARKFKISALREGWAWTQRDWLSVTSDTGVGNPKAATPEKGRRYFEAVTQKIAGFLVELAKADRKDLYE